MPHDLRKLKLEGVLTGKEKQPKKGGEKNKLDILREVRGERRPVHKYAHYVFDGAIDADFLNPTLVVKPLKAERF